MIISVPSLFKTLFILSLLSVCLDRDRPFSCLPLPDTPVFRFSPRTYEKKVRDLFPDLTVTYCLRCSSTNCFSF